MAYSVKKFDEFLKRLSTKGFLDTIHYVQDNEGCHYNDIAKFLLGKRIINSRASVTTIINTLLNLELVERSVANTKPVRTTYKTTKRATDNMKLLNNMRKTFR